ncbi:MAG: hypothetical protein J6Y27_04215 [Bacteroidales bacterium]|nr:hypothetical protein [Bacteroidales bacterium]
MKKALIILLFLCCAASADGSVVLQKRSEGEQGRMTVRSLETDGSLLVAHSGRGIIRNYAGHRKVASLVIPYIATLTGWDMPFTPYR